MRNHFSALILLLAGLIATTNLQAQTPANAPAPNDTYAQQISALTQRYQAFRIYSEDNAKFSQVWLKKARDSAAENKVTAQVPTYVLSTGAEIIMDAINPYLLRSDDASASGYLKVLAKLIGMGAENEVVCRAFLKSDTEQGLSDAENAYLEASVGPKIYDDMMIAFGNVFRTGRSGPPKIPSTEDYDRYMGILIDGMLDKYGEKSLNELANIESPDMPPMAKCRTMTQLMNSMADMPLNQQAVMVRKMFASED